MRSSLLVLSVAGAGFVKAAPKHGSPSSSDSSACICYATVSSTAMNYVATKTPKVTQTLTTTVPGATKVAKITSFVEDDFTQTVTERTTVTTIVSATPGPAVQARDVSVAEDNKKTVNNTKQCVCPTTSTTTNVKTVKATLTIAPNVITKWSKVTGLPVTITSTIYRNASEAVATDTVYSTVLVTKTSAPAMVTTSSTSSALTTSIAGKSGMLTSSASSFSSSISTTSSAGPGWMTTSTSTSSSSTSSAITSSSSTSSAATSSITSFNTSSTTLATSGTSTSPAAATFADCSTTPSSFYIQIQGTDQYLYLTSAVSRLGNITEAAAFSLDNNTSAITTPDYEYDYFSYPGEAQGELLYSVYGNGAYDWEPLMFAPLDRAYQNYEVATFDLNADCTITLQDSAWYLQTTSDEVYLWGLVPADTYGLSEIGPNVTFVAVPATEDS